LRIFVAPFLGDDGHVAPRYSQQHSQDYSQQHSQEEKFARSPEPPASAANPIMRRDALTELFYSQGCDLGL
jgi:hypothetical protein